MTKGDNFFKRLRPHWPFLALSAAVALFLFRETAFEGKAFAGSLDLVKNEVPRLFLAAENLARGTWPQWNPYIFSGVRFLGDAAVRLLYPPNWLITAAFADHIPLALSWRIIAETFLMLALSYLLFLKVWSGRGLAAFSALAYSLSTWNMQQANQGLSYSGFVYLPLLLYFAWDWPQRSMGRNIAGIGLTAALIVAAGLYQYSAYFLLFAFVVAARHGHFRRLLLIFAAAGAIAFACNAVEIFPFLQAQKMSNRIAAPFEEVKGSMGRPWHLGLLRIVVPYLLGDYTNFLLLSDKITLNYMESYTVYAGCAVFFFALMALAGLRRNTEVRFLAAAAVVLTLMAFPTPLAWIPYKLFLHAPLVHARLACLIPFCLAMLAALGIRIFLEAGPRRRICLTASAPLAAGLLWIAAAAPAELPFSLLRLVPLQELPADLPLADLRLRFIRAASIPAAASIFLAALMALFHWGRIKETAFKAALCLMLAADLTYFARAHALQLYFLKESDWYPRDPLIQFMKTIPDADQYRWYTDPVLLTGLPPFELLQPNYNLVYRWRDINGFINLVPARYAELLAPGQPSLRRLPWRLLQSPSLADLVSVKYFVIPNHPNAFRFFSSFTRPIAVSENVLLLEKPDALPRVRLACRVMEARSAQHVRELAHQKGINLRDTVFAGPETKWKYDWSSASPCPKMTLEILEEYGGYLKARVKSEAPALLVHTEIWDPGWRAKINGRPAAVHRVNHTFQALELDAGESIVEMRFRAPFYGATLILTAAAALILLSLIFYDRLIPKPNRWD